jgi:hypothetical protein
MKALIATFMPAYLHARILDRVLARALVHRGLNVDILVCNAAIKVCQMTKIGRIEPMQLAAGGRMNYCNKCTAANEQMKNPLWNVRKLTDYISHDKRNNEKEIAGDVNKLRKYRYKEIAIGEHAYAGALRYLARGDLNDDFGLEIFQQYISQSMVLVDALINLFESVHYDVIVVNHGIYIPQGILVNLAEKYKIRIVTYNPAYKKQTFIFSHNKSYHYTMLDEPESDWYNFEWTQSKSDSLREYLQSRRTGEQDWIWFHNEPVNNFLEIINGIGADATKPVVTVLTSVMWDAQLHYSKNVFENMLDWLYITIQEWKKKETETQLIIRVHPAELRGQVPSRQRVQEEIYRKIGKLPVNVFLISPENEASTYVLCENSLAVIIYNTKTGAELGATKTPVIVAGEAWIRNKGIGYDINSLEQYKDVICNIEKLNLSNNKHRGEKYAYHFFNRRMIPLPFLDLKEDKSLNITDEEFYRNGKYKGIETICNGIINGASFIYEP